MSKGRAKAKRQRNRERLERAERSRHLPAQVPSDALFCNVTELTNKYIRQGCSLTVPPVMRLVYLVIGVGLGIAAVLARVFGGISTLLLVLMLLLGFSFVWQSMHLGMEPARKMMRQYNKVADETGRDPRHHVYYATDRDFGVVLFDGTVRQFPWTMVDTFSGTKDTFALTLKNNPIVFILDSQGFLRGSSEDFVRFAFEKIDPTPKSALYNLSAKAFRTLDNWSVVKAEARMAEAQKKQQRKAERLARKEAARRSRSEG